MSDLTYSVDRLQQLSRGLARLAGDVESDGSLRDVGLQDVARTEVVDALRAFTDDWDDRRVDVVASLRALAEMTSGAADGFSQVDADLAAKVRDAMDAAR